MTIFVGIPSVSDLLQSQSSRETNFWDHFVEGGADNGDNEITFARAERDGFFFPFDTTTSTYRLVISGTFEPVEGAGYQGTIERISYFNDSDTPSFVMPDLQLDAATFLGLMDSFVETRASDVRDSINASLFGDVTEIRDPGQVLTVTDDINANTIVMSDEDNHLNFIYHVPDGGVQVDGGAGFDWLGLDVEAPQTISLSDSQFTVRGQLIQQENFEALHVRGTGVTLIGRDGADDALRVTVNLAGQTPFTTPVNRIEGLGGNDTLLAGFSRTILDGGDGDDSIVGYWESDILIGGLGDDILKGDRGDDSIDAGAGDDVVFGGSNSDTITAGIGADTVAGGDGQDLVFLNQGHDRFNDNGQGGEIGQDTVYAGFGNDTIEGGNGNDMFFGGNGGDVINGRLGDDQIFGGIGFDTISAGFGNDTVFGGNGRDLVFLNEGDDLYNDNTQGGEFGQDTVFGGLGDDTIEGGNGSDSFTGGAGDDVINGGADSDTLTGDDGADLFVFARAEAETGTDLVTDFELGVDQLGFFDTPLGETSVSYDSALNEVTVTVRGTDWVILQSEDDLSGFGLDDITILI